MFVSHHSQHAPERQQLLLPATDARQPQSELRGESCSGSFVAREARARRRQRRT